MSTPGLQVVEFEADVTLRTQVRAIVRLASDPSKPPYYFTAHVRIDGQLWSFDELPLDVQENLKNQAVAQAQLDQGRPFPGVVDVTDLALRSKG